jgi:hypothetical protein
MFALLITEPPTPAMKKACQLIDDCKAYIFGSTDSTAKYLTESLKWIEGIAPTLEATQGNTERSF